MFLWFLSVIFFVGGIIRVLTDFPLGSLVGNIGAIGRERNVLVRTISIFQEFEETLSAGLLPNPERWRVLEKLPFPWGTLASESIQELRSQGGALLPTLRRLRVFAEQHLAALGEVCPVTRTSIDVRGSGPAIWACPLYFVTRSRRPATEMDSGLLSRASSLRGGSPLDVGYG